MCSRKWRRRRNARLPPPSRRASPSHSGGCRPGTPASALNGPRPRTPDGLEGGTRGSPGAPGL
ncbi:hypothetical protein DMA10_26085 [Streptomyces sp. WAC 01420]|nr:hypothetical protein DMA10_26085 [Streptomyces sp. WAC 01420]